MERTVKANKKDARSSWHERGVARQIKVWKVFRFSASPGCRIRRRGRHHPGCRHRRSHVRKKQLLHGIRNFIPVRQQLTDLPNLRVRQFGLKRGIPVKRIPLAVFQ